MALKTPLLCATERLRIHHWDMSDVEACFDFYKRPEVVQYLGIPVEASIESMTTRLEYIIKRNLSCENRLGSWPVYDDSDNLVGTAIVAHIPGKGDVLTTDMQIGWHVHPDHWGKGYATEFGHALVRYGFDTLKEDVLHVLVEPPNQASIKVALRVGAQPQGRTDRYYDLELEHFLIHPPG